jgi:hypothetical protein
MTITTYQPSSTMREARARYFEVNDFGVDGGYGDAWVDFKLGPVPMPFPNTEGRVRAVAYHDLHHILTGYDTEIIGELEIAAWELGAGCKSFHMAWLLNLGGLAGGLFAAPRRTWRAFVRGMHSRSFYGRDLEALLDLPVAEARREMGVDEARDARATPRDAALFAVASAVGLVVGAAFLVMGVVLAPIGLALGAARKRPAETARAA